MVYSTDKKTAIDITIRFLSQHFSVQIIDAVLEDKTWIVAARIGMFGKTMSAKNMVTLILGLENN
ncbi:MAG TPA: hypothetical protein VFX64_00470 [Candidatus Nitrosotalea sp.]|nr:hypothetical protein [Candidatus Nitrosotalea sp.]